MFGSWVLKLPSRTVFENTKNTILVFFENCYCYLNFMFYVFSMFFKKKKKLGTKLVLIVFIAFENRKHF